MEKKNNILSNNKIDKIYNKSESFDNNNNNCEEIYNSDIYDIS